MFVRSLKPSIAFCAFLAFFSASREVCGATLFVNAAATGANDGSSWTDAYTDLQSALTRATKSPSISAIWVAAGTYKPAGPGGSRESTFRLVNRVMLLGGFSGSETEAGQRNPRLHATILSGDLDGDDDEGPEGGNCCDGHPTPGCTNKECQALVCAEDDFCCETAWDRTCALQTVCLCGRLCSARCDNSYHVVSAGVIDTNSILDGFTIVGGTANGGAALQRRGGGLTIEGGSPTIVDCVFFDNSAAGPGGGLFTTGAARVINCTFVGNTAESGGGAAVLGASPSFTNCVFSGNETTVFGGGVSLTSSLSRLTQCTFSRNHAGSGGGIDNREVSEPIITNSIFWSNTDRNFMFMTAQIGGDAGSLAIVNYSNIQGESGFFGGIGNIALDPLFVSDTGEDQIPGTPDDDLRLSSGSPSIDAGRNSSVPPDAADLDDDGNRSEPTPLDRAGFARFFDDPRSPNSGDGAAPIVDMGAFEVSSDCNMNGRLDDEDVAAMSSRDCNGNHIPDECEIREGSPAPGGPFFCILDCDADCNVNAIPDACEPDGDDDGLTDSCDHCPDTPPDVPVDNVGCSLPGACCFTPNGSICFDNLQDVQCAAIQGTFLGYGLSCLSDLDEDGVRGCADHCPDDPEKSEPGQCGCGVPDDDLDGDGVVGCLDRCPLDNPDDTDGDGVCNSVDPCPLDPSGDSDGDGVCDSQDPCPLDNPDDNDGDGVCNSMDACPDDPTKGEPGICGCGVSEDDTDHDGVVDCLDECPNTPSTVPVDEFGCPAVGACCFRIGVCADDTRAADCKLVGGIYQGNRSVCSAGCAPMGDLDRDQDVDADDYTLFYACVPGPTTGRLPNDCVLGDFDANEVIDLRDIAAFQRAFTGPL